MRVAAPCSAVSLPYKPVEAPVAVTSAGSAPKHSEVSVLSLGDKASPASDAKLPDAPQGTILLVDDNDDFLNFLSGELSAYYTIRTASDGKQALESIHKSMPDLVLTDVMMPEMDGNELVGRSRVTTIRSSCLSSCLQPASLMKMRLRAASVAQTIM